LTAIMTMMAVAATGPAANLMDLAIARSTQRTIAIELALLTGRGCSGSPSQIQDEEPAGPKENPSPPFLDWTAPKVMSWPQSLNRPGLPIFDLDKRMGDPQKPGPDFARIGGPDLDEG
jgi:hypothetical protein